MTGYPHICGALTFPIGDRGRDERNCALAFSFPNGHKNCSNTDTDPSHVPKYFIFLCMANPDMNWTPLGASMICRTSPHFLRFNM